MSHLWCSSSYKHFNDFVMIKVQKNIAGLFLGMASFIRKFWVLSVRNCSMSFYSTLSRRLILWVSQATSFNQVNQWEISSGSQCFSLSSSSYRRCRKRVLYDSMIENKVNTCWEVSIFPSSTNYVTEESVNDIYYVNYVMVPTYNLVIPMSVGLPN